MLVVSKSREFQATIDDGKNEYLKLFVLACRVVSWIEFGCQFNMVQETLAMYTRKSRGPRTEP